MATNDDMNDETNAAEAPTRFELLVGRFFDGELSEAEDREFVSLLDSDAALARHFIEIARLDRAIMGLSSIDRVSKEAFDAAVVRSLNLDNENESHRFAQEVVQMVRAGSERRRTRRLAATSVRKNSDAAIFAIAAAACLALVLVSWGFMSGGSTNVAALNPQQPSPSPAAIPPAGVENPTAANTDLRKAPSPDKRATPPEIQNEPRQIASAAPLDEQSKNRIAEPEVRHEKPQNSPSAASADLAAAQNQPDESPSELAANPTQVLAKVERLSNVKAVMLRKRTQADVTDGTQFLDSDVIRVSGIAVSPGDAVHSDVSHLIPGSSIDGAEVTLLDGSRVWLAPGSELRFHAENDSICPTLISGEMRAQVRPQKPGHPLRVRTLQGPAVEVVGTVFRLAAESGRKRVTLHVDEGKVLFTSQGVERRVAADETCDAEDGKAPGAPVRFRLSPAILSGVAIDKATGKPLPGIMIRAIPQARRKVETHLASTRTDAQGRFKFDALREGVYFVVAEVEGVSASMRFGIVRANLISREETPVSVMLDKPAIVVGALEENTRHISTKETRVRYIPEGSDGPAVSPVLQLVDGREPRDNEYVCAVIEGAGKYAPLIEKPGMLIKVRTPRNVQLVTDRLNQWVLDVLISPSATIKGRVLDAVSNPLADELGLDPADPHQLRTVLTLTPAGNPAHTACAETDGSFQFNTNLDAGTYELKAQRYGYATATKRITLTAGQALDVDITLEPSRTHGK